MSLPPAEGEVEGQVEAAVVGLDPFGGGGSGNCVNSCKYTAIRFGYAKNGQAVTHVVGESWCWDEPAYCSSTGVPGYYKVNWAREFRYDGARARYMDRKLSTTNLMVEATAANGGSTVWTDYDGDEAYSDLITTGSGVNATSAPGGSYQPGMWRRLKNAVGTGFTADYLHGDMLGTLRQTTDGFGASSGGDVFTAFGERMAGSADRYGYVGAHGYQSTLDSGGAEVFPFLHLGARYCDPASGRFLQRDPIGIHGGPHVYAYVGSRSTIAIDSAGLSDTGWPSPPYRPRLPYNPKNDEQPSDELRRVRRHIKIIKSALKCVVFYVAGSLPGGPAWGAAGAGASGAADIVDALIPAG